jgi:hypothetical protein
MSIKVCIKCKAALCTFMTGIPCFSICSPPARKGLSSLSPSSPLSLCSVTSLNELPLGDSARGLLVDALAAKGDLVLACPVRAGDSLPMSSELSDFNLRSEDDRARSAVAFGRSGNWSGSELSLRDDRAVDFPRGLDGLLELDSFEGS